jgi:hypothetical protein
MTWSSSVQGSVAARLPRLSRAAGSTSWSSRKQTVYHDRVRGEWLAPWGVVEVLRLGLDEVLLGAGGGYGTQIIPYDETLPPEAAATFTIQLDQLLPNVAGSLNVGHLQSCEALNQAAVRAGATVKRGVGGVVLDPGPRPQVSYELDGREHRVRCRLVVGADGRSSSIRHQASVELRETVPRIMGAGLLIEGLREWPEHLEAIGTEGETHFLIFPRPGGFARLYIMWDIAQRTRFSGAEGTT